jgi:hypothetical protein
MACSVLLGHKHLAVFVTKHNWPSHHTAVCSPVSVSCGSPAVHASSEATADMHIGPRTPASKMSSVLYGLYFEKYYHTLTCHDLGCIHPMQLIQQRQDLQCAEGGQHVAVVAGA